MRPGYHPPVPLFPPALFPPLLPKAASAPLRRPKVYARELSRSARATLRRSLRRRSLPRAAGRWEEKEGDFASPLLGLSRRTDRRRFGARKRIRRISYPAVAEETEIRQEERDEKEDDRAERKAPLTFARGAPLASADRCAHS
ncbi:hypothetical protein KM043_012353 [Ampulex compressa]|nr:hypothetical protein KM043_012353 [Ampulex compressa]